MKKNRILLLHIFLLFCACQILTAGHAQYSRFIVEIKDKNSSPFSLSHPDDFLSQRAIGRRTRQQLSLDSSDLPIPPAYLQAIRQVPNLQILNWSKWLNQVLIRTTDSAALSTVALLPFVQKTAPIADRRGKASFGDSVVAPQAFRQRTADLREATVTADRTAAGNTVNQFLGNVLNYGNSFSQIHIHRGEYLHNLGFRGQGMVIAVLDAGFQAYQTNPAFDSIRINNQVLGTYDYVNLKQSVNEENIHGAWCLSIMAANEPGQMTGSAPAAKFWLLKTEDVKSEFPVEEQNWVAAAEFADSAGADLISTSLGYDYFDDSSFNLSYGERNGHFSIISRGANLAAAKGMIVTASAGNSGLAPGEQKYVGCPADADSVLTIGAINIQGTIADFSSWGPNASGLLKPNVVSVGQGTVIAQPDGLPVLGNGTSFSNPNLAGLIACLWQAFPEFTNHQILTAVTQSADRYQTPDYHYGYGIPDFNKAFRQLADLRALSQFENSGSSAWFSAYPVPFWSDFSVLYRPAATGTATIRLLDALGRTLQIQSFSVRTSQAGLIHFTRTEGLSRGLYFLSYEDAGHHKTLKIIKQ